MPHRELNCSKIGQIELQLVNHNHLTISVLIGHEKLYSAA